MSQGWKIRVQPAGLNPFAFKATFVTSATDRDEFALESRYVYGDGDLAVLLEDLGARGPEICLLIETLQESPSAEIRVDVTDEAMEVLARGVGVRGVERA